MAIVVYLALLAVAFFFLIVRPQRRQMAVRKALIQAVEVGDEIITAGGIYGVVISIGDDTMEVAIAPGTTVTLAREAVARRREEPPPEGGAADVVDVDDGPDPDAAAEED